MMRRFVSVNTRMSAEVYKYVWHFKDPVSIPHISEVTVCSSTDLSSCYTIFINLKVLSPKTDTNWFSDEELFGLKRTSTMLSFSNGLDGILM